MIVITIIIRRRRPPPAVPIVQYGNLLFFWRSGKGFDGEAGVDWEGPEDADCDELVGTSCEDVEKDDASEDSGGLLRDVVAVADEEINWEWPEDGDRCVEDIVNAVDGRLVTVDWYVLGLVVTGWETVDKDDPDDDCGGLVEDFGLVVGACDNEASEEVDNGCLEGGINSVR